MLTLVIGIGLNSVAFSAFNGIHFRAQVTRDPASFVQTYSFVTGDRDRQWHTASVLMKVAGDPHTLMQVVRTEVRALDPQLFVSTQTVATTIATESERYAEVVKLVAIPAGLAVFLSLMGIYGVTAFAAAQRRHEVGIRSALGARPQEIVSLFFFSLRWPLLAGLTVGILLSALGNRLLQQAHLVTDVTLADPWAYGSALLLLMCAAGATLMPALRAAHAEPWLVLRGD